MDDLTARALQNQNNANANYNSKQQREETQKALTEAPAFITGFEGGKYQVEHLGQGPVAIGVPMTNGLLQVGQRATMTGQYVDGVTRVKPVVPVVKVVEATGKIKYLYRVGSDYWVGGWRQKPVFVKTLEPGEALSGFKNLGGNSWSVDSIIRVPPSGEAAKVRTITPQGVIYESRLTSGALDDQINGGGSLGHSFFARGSNAGAIGGSSGSDGLGSWFVAFQGIVTAGRTSTVGTAYYSYLLPGLRAPFFEGDVTTSAYGSYATNQSGDRGVGIAYTLPTDTSPRPACWFAGTTITTIGNVTAIPINPGRTDCFDDRFSVISSFDDPMQKARFLAKIDLFSSDGASLGATPTNVYGIPSAQRSTAILLGVSYHP